MKRLSQLMFLLLVACAPIGDNPKYTPSQIIPTQTVSIHEFISNHESLTSCLELNPQESTQQAQYNNIYPGKTSSNDLLSLLGEPTNKLSYGSEVNWLYDKSPVSIVVVNDVVDQIYVNNYESSALNLKQIVEEYGCPKLIYVTDRSEHSSGKYDSTVFLYTEIGVEFWFDGTLISLSSTSRESRYFKPMSLADYIQSYKDYLYIDSPISEPVYWDDVVVGK